MKFSVDCMLGKLARWLRAPGFSLCPGCGRIFWEGTHQNDIEEMIADILRKG